MNLQELDSGTLVEICEENVIIGSGCLADAASGAVAMMTPNVQLLTAAGYSIEGTSVYECCILLYYRKDNIFS